MDLCLQKNSRDNMSVLIVQLPGATQPSEYGLVELLGAAP